MFSLSHDFTLGPEGKNKFLSVFYYYLHCEIFLGCSSKRQNWTLIFFKANKSLTYTVKVLDQKVASKLNQRISDCVRKCRKKQ